MRSLVQMLRHGLETLHRWQHPSLAEVCIVPEDAEPIECVVICFSTRKKI